MGMGRYLEIIKALPYERNERNERNVPDSEKPSQQIGEEYERIPLTSNEQISSGHSFVFSANSSQEKTASQSILSFLSFLSYIEGIPDLSTDERCILERATLRECSFLVDLLTDSSLKGLHTTQQAVSALLKRGLLERTPNGRNGTWVYFLPKRVTA